MITSLSNVNLSLYLKLLINNQLKIFHNCRKFFFFFFNYIFFVIIYAVKLPFYNDAKSVTMRKIQTSIASQRYSLVYTGYWEIFPFFSWFEFMIQNLKKKIHVYTYRNSNCVKQSLQRKFVDIDNINTSRNNHQPKSTLCPL